MAKVKGKVKILLDIRQGPFGAGIWAPWKAMLQ